MFMYKFWFTAIYKYTGPVYFFVHLFGDSIRLIKLNHANTAMEFATPYTRILNSKTGVQSCIHFFLFCYITKIVGTC